MNSQVIVVYGPKAGEWGKYRWVLLDSISRTAECYCYAVRF